MSSIGHPLIGDPVYGPSKDHFHLNGQMLHAMTLGFIHPGSQEYVSYEAALPAYFERFLVNLRNMQ
jgi:23S rRNA pseudouridine1911/1915/1917 synthase